MDKQTIAWLAFGVYAVATAGLALRGMSRTKSLSGFALGNGDLGPVITGITLAAAIASTATFVINPGFVYKSGLAALLHFGVASFSGVVVGLVLFSKGFRRLGMEGRVLTLPQWVGARYGHSAMRTYFAVLNLVLSIAFVVLIVKGSALVMQHTLGTTYVVSLVIIVGFVFSYILMGGTYAHVYTNALQGALMVAVAILIVGSGLSLFSDGVGAFFSQLAAQDPNLVKPLNPEAPLFDSAWGVLVCGFVVGVGLVAQPHILTKSMYLRSDRDVNRYLIIASSVWLIFTMILMAGMYARIRYPDIVRQDEVMAIYLARSFSPITGVLISVALLAAGMSTLDGILVSASTIAANDVFLGALGQRLLGDKTEEERHAVALKASRYIIVAMGVVSFVVALDPPKLVGIFAQVGIYGLVAASLAPIAGGIFVKELASRDVFLAALVGPLVHFAHYGVVVWGQGKVLNPAISATSGILSALGLLTVLTLARRYGALSPARAATGDAPGAR
ncbi:MAG: sodium:solute symporter family protein [Myxococcales bacterium]|nr:sodium:solute symporter family protein [Myxococcales bacterium]MCB9646252.1 sodium:solute symporter family protein [Deltaproteobacteria bacterium]